MAVCESLRVEVNDGGGTLGVLVGWRARIEKYKSEGATFGRQFCTKGLDVCAACAASNPGCTEFEPIDQQFVNDKKG